MFEKVWNQKDESAIDRMPTPGVRSHGFPNADSVLTAPDDFKDSHRVFCGAFSDLNATLQNMIAEGDRVAIRWKVQVTHLGDHLGIPANRKKAGRLWFVLHHRRSASVQPVGFEALMKHLSAA